MSPTEAFIKRLEALQEGERSRLRRLAGRPLDHTLPSFDLFTGLWWPLRAKSPAAPRREPAWLVAKLYGAFPIPHVQRDSPAERPTLPRLLGRCEPREEFEGHRFRKRFDALLCSPMTGIEPHLHWALRVITDVVEKQRTLGLDWAQLLDDLSIWERGEEHRRKRDVRDLWAEQYLNATDQP